jgi:hypothetical protein
LQGYFGALGAFLLNQGIEIDGSNDTAEEGAKPSKTRHTKGKLHHRSKSLGSMTPLSNNEVDDS